jgi:hypothetical protein
MATDSNSVANQAIQLIGNNVPPVSGESPTWDSTPAGLALQELYGPCVATVARRFAWDMARSTIALALTGNAAPAGWSFEYLYPASGIEVWQIAPQTLADANNPLPVNFNIGNTLVAGLQAKVIWTNQASAYATYNNNPSEAVWDSLFRESVVRQLASELAMALFGRPDTSESLLQQSNAYEQAGESRRD